jgi:sugar-phosphate isomerases, RpiB/LacA/LacB family
MRIAVGCDHVMVELKNRIAEYAASKGHVVQDMGTLNGERTHYPIYGKRVADSVASGQADRGILVCGSGLGISISANKVAGIRAVVGNGIDTVRYARQQLNANVMGVGGMVTGWGVVQDMVDAFLETDYSETEANKRWIEEIDGMVRDNGQMGDVNIFSDLLQKWDRGEYNC